MIVIDITTEYNKAFGVVLSEKEKMIAQWSYNLGLKHNNKKDVTTKTIKVDVSQLNSDNFRSNCKSLAKSRKVELEILFDGTSWGFPWNTIHYKLIVKGEIEDIALFEKDILN